MLDKKQIQANFLFKFKRSDKAVETTRNINNAFHPGSANEHTVQRWFRKFGKDDESPEDGHRSRWWKDDRCSHYGTDRNHSGAEA